MLSLNEQSGFNRLTEYYEQNKNNHWTDWLEVEQIFPCSGKQGLVGLMRGKKDPSIVYIFKLSQYINYLTQHENIIMNSLNEVSDYCPNFCRVIGAICCQIDPTQRKDGNPFNQHAKYKIEKEVLLCEYLDKSYKFCNYIFSDKASEDILYCIIKQVLLGVSLVQKEKKFTHYDLHSNNVMIKRCSRDLVFLYILDDENQFCVSSRGCYPVIIDFGFSYIQDMDGEPLWATLNQTDIGFTTDRFDSFSDPKLFLVTVSDEIHEARKSRKSRKLKNITKNIYNNLKLDWDSGWDDDTEKCATDYVLEIFSKHSKISKLFNHFEYYCIDILQSLIILPLEKQNYDNIEVAFLTFLTEFIKIEREISSPFFCLYILQGIVDAAREVRVDYIDKEKRQGAVGFFKLSIDEKVKSVSSFCNLKNIEYEKMLCALFCLSKAIEGVLYEAMKKRTKQKNNYYSKLPLQNINQIISAIDINIEDDYIFNEKTNILVIDNINKACFPFQLTSEETEQINSFSSISRGTEIFEIIKNRNNFSQ
jgi:hypothetical protein